MATNTFNNIADITPVAMDVLENNLVFSKHVNRGHDDRFRETGGKIGDTANIRIPGYYTVRSGKVASPQGYNDTFASVTLTQKGVDIQFSSKELRLNVDEFKRNVLEPALVPLANQIDLDLCNLLTGVNQATYGATAGAKLTDLEQFLQAQALLDEMAIPRNNRSAVINPRTNANIVKGLSGLYNPQTAISEQFNSGNIGHALGMDWSMDQNLLPFTTGVNATGTPLMNGVTADGATSIVTDGWAGSGTTVNAGDVITIEGVYAVNPVTKTSTGQLKQFVVTTTNANATTKTLAISPAIIASGPTQNVSNVPANDKHVYFWGGADPVTNTGAVCATSAVFHRDAFLLACADLPKVGPSELCSRIKSKVSDISFRMIKYYDGRNDDELYRLDVLYGVALLRPNHAVRVLG